MINSMNIPVPEINNNLIEKELPPNKEEISSNKEELDDYIN